MSPIAGWYPDPAGSPDLRYWDGADWSAETAPATPAAVTTVTLAPEEPAHPTQPAAAAQFAQPAAQFPVGQTYQPAPPAPHFDYVISKATPIHEQPARIGRIPVPRGTAWSSSGPQRPAQQSKARGAISGRMIAGGVAVVALLGGGAYYFMNQHHGGAVRVSAHTSIVMPSEIAGLPQTNTHDSDELQRIMNSASVPKPHLVGFYGSAGQNPAAFVMVAKYPQTADQVAHNLSMSLRTLDENVGNLTFWKDTDPGPLGGTMRCATVVQGGASANVCMFEDTDVVGMSFSYGTATAPGPDAVTLRDGVEHRN